MSISGKNRISRAVILYPCLTEMKKCMPACPFSSFFIKLTSSVIGSELLISPYIERKSMPVMWCELSQEKCPNQSNCGANIE